MTETMVAIVEAPIDAEAMVRGIKAGSDGAVCVFDGIVRDNTRGRKTLYLDYEAYRDMALAQMRNGSWPMRRSGEVWCARRGDEWCTGWGNGACRWARPACGSRRPRRTARRRLRGDAAG